MALATSLAAIAPFVTLAFTCLCVRVELFLQVAECLIAQPLLLAQSVRKTLHRLLTGGLAALALLPFGDAHVLHQLLQFFQRFGSFGHAPLLHQFLNAVHHALQIVLGHLHAIALRLLVLAVLTALLLRLLALQLLDVIFGSTA